LLLGLAAGALAPVAAAPPVVVTDNGEVRQELPDHRVMFNREIALSCGDFACNLTFRNMEFYDAAGKKDRSEGTVGVQFWPENGQGWYPNPSFVVSLDGTPLSTNAVVKNTRVLEQGASALVETTLEHAKGSVRVRFAYRPGQEGLDVQLVLLPAAGAPPVKQLSVDLTAYPAFFTIWNKRRGDRWVVTPTRSFEEPREAGLDMDAKTWKHQTRDEQVDLAQENWLFYYDKFFNSADGNGKGMCGLVFLPLELQTGQVTVSNYEIVTKLAAKPDQRSLEFTLWQTTERDYSPPLQRFPQIADAARQRLQDSARFLPQTLVGFDPAAEARGLQPLAKAPGADQLNAKLQAVVDAIAGVKAAPASLDLEQTALDRLAVYRRALWQAGRSLPRPRRILVLAGPDYPVWKLDEAAATTAGDLVLDKSFFSTNWKGDRLTTFPATEAEMLQYDAVVFLNVSATPLRESGEALLKQFVMGGGGLVVCGGFYAYGEGFYQQSVLADLLPVTMGGAFDVKRLPAPAAVVAGAKVSGLPAAGPGVALWLQDLQAKPAATVPLVADLGAGKRAPFLVVGRAGEGRVAACAGTVYGEAPAGKTEFWNRPEWPTYVAALLRWVCAPSGK
jgi:uncharacterized membrane protein